MNLISFQTIAIIGLGYVGLPLAIAFTHAAGIRRIVGFDIDQKRIADLQAGLDVNGEAGAELSAALSAGLTLTHDEQALSEVDVMIVTVPTPVNDDKRPDLAPLQAACELIAGKLRPGMVVIFESTVYPGCTEDFCAPILAKLSGLRFNEDFFLGYSPERINPGDRLNRLSSIVKITSGSTPQIARLIDALYKTIITAGTFSAADIRTAEAAKVIENVQRDVNIALVNEFAQICAHLKLDSDAVLQAARSKWNFLDFRPGLVGGHCIGVDPYYLIHKSQLAGFHPALIATARVVNEGMVGHITAEVLKLCARRGLTAAGMRVLMMGVAFKEDCADTRNSRVLDIAIELQSYGAEIAFYDPVVAGAHGTRVSGIDLIEPQPGAFDLVIIAVRHAEFVALGASGIREFLRPHGLIFDVKRLLATADSDARL
jgi:UDP-N-acetyl-D-glucosamine/UDP-N-acetyl-D-galactosamine dehydrogenase